MYKKSIQYTKSIDSFWRDHPALLYGLASLFACGYALTFSSINLFAIALLATTSASTLRRFYGRLSLIFAVSSAAFLYTAQTVQLPDQNVEKILGTCWFSPSSIEEKRTHFGAQWVYRGKAKVFYGGKERVGKNIPCSLTLSSSRKIERPPADQEYLVKGTLIKSHSGAYFLKVDPKEEWHPIAGSSSLAEWRWEVKQQIKHFILRQIKNKQSATFLSGLTTGHFENQLLHEEFGKLGLQHLMAISGFHFALIAGFCAFFLQLFLPQRVAILSVISLLLTYFIAIGPTPSILRAWIMSSIVLLGMLYQKRATPLNTLGFAILFIVIYAPTSILTLGFQFSFLVTASILLFYPLFSHYFQTLLPNRPLGQMLLMSYFDQHCYCLLKSFKELLALGAAVNLTALPLTLYHFGKFPLLSPLFNLIFPFLLSVTLTTFLLGTAFYPFGRFLYEVADWLTTNLLKMVENVPHQWELYYRSTVFSSDRLFLFLVFLFFSGIWIKHRVNVHAMPSIIGFCK